MTGRDSVAVPWGTNRYFYTVKAPALPVVSGSVTIDGSRTIPIGHDAWAVLDRGRGRWRYMNRWNWAGAGGVNADGRRVGFSLGENAKEDGTTENALVVDKVLDFGHTKIEWEYDINEPSKPWRLKADWVDATLTPWHVRKASVNMLLVASSTVQVFGDWSGWAVLKDGTRVSLDGASGFAEEAWQRY